VLLAFVCVKLGRVVGSVDPGFVNFQLMKSVQLVCAACPVLSCPRGGYVRLEWPRQFNCPNYFCRWQRSTVFVRLGGQYPQAPVPAALLVAECRNFDADDRAEPAYAG
jgi:hypothetical protein